MSAIMMSPFLRTTVPWISAAAIISTILAVFASVFQWSWFLADSREVLSFIVLCALCALGLSVSHFFNHPEGSVWDDFNHGFFLLLGGTVGLMMVIALITESFRFDHFLYVLLGLFVPVYLAVVLGYKMYKRLNQKAG